jgi:hypothetical protein
MNEINNKRIKIKKPINLGNKKVFNLYYLSQAKTEIELLLQSPELIIPYGKIQSQDIDEIQFDCCNDKFIRDIEYIRDYIIDKIRKYDNNLLKNRIHFDQIKKKDFGKILRCKISNADVNIYDQNGNIITDEDLKANRKIQLIINIKCFWVSSNYYGIEYSVLQIKIHKPPDYNKIMFTNIPNLDQDINLDKYNKMLKLRIPLEAVEAKMKLDGLSPITIKNFIEDKEKETQDVPTNTSMRPTSFLSQISMGDFKLKSVSKNPINNEEEIKKKVLDKMSKYVDMNKKIPSLDDILSARANLKKI